MKDKDSEKAFEKYEEIFCHLIKKSPLIREQIACLCRESVRLPETRAEDSQTAQLKDRLKELQKELSSTQNEKKEKITELNKLNEQKDVVINELRQNIGDRDKDIAELRSLIDEKDKTIKKLEKSIENERNEKEAAHSSLKAANKTITELRGLFDEPIAYLKRYRELPETIKEGLYNVISDKNEICFISSCTSEDNLKAVWNYTKNIIGSTSDHDTINTLKEIFDYFFDIYNASLPEAKYARDDVETGDELDDELHDRCSGSATSGEINEVLLRGYRSVNTGRIICRSLVKA